MVELKSEKFEKNVNFFDHGTVWPFLEHPV